MATQISKNRKRVPSAAPRKLAHLRAEVSRLRSEIRTLKANKSQRTKPGNKLPTDEQRLPVLPLPDADGNYAALEALDVIVARHIIRRRRAAGWTQAELARRAGVRPETLSRLETGKHAPNVATVDKLDQALRAPQV
jgi:DNA-binding XRE family transcriptional regulator